MSDLWRQVVAISPVYCLQVCYGMSSAFPAILTPQLTQDCALFTISADQESWIGESTQSRGKRDIFKALSKIDYLEFLNREGVVGELLVGV